MTHRFLLILLVLFVCNGAAYGGLRTLGRPETIGVVPGQPAHLVVVLEGCEWAAIDSTDAGETWAILAKAQIPEVLEPLPSAGDPSYWQADGYVFVSHDAGASWKPVEWGSLLREAIREDVAAEKARYIESYGHWLPVEPNERKEVLWTMCFILTGLGIGGVIASQQGKSFATLVQSVSLTVGAYILIGVGLAWIGEHVATYMLYEQWTLRMRHWDNGIMYPKWPLGVFLHLTCTVILAPVTAVLVLPFTPIMPAASEGHRTAARRVRQVLLGLGVAFMALIAAALFAGHGWQS